MFQFAIIENFHEEYPILTSFFAYRYLTFLLYPDNRLLFFILHFSQVSAEAIVTLLYQSKMERSRNVTFKLQCAIYRSGTEGIAQSVALKAIKQETKVFRSQFRQLRVIAISMGRKCLMGKTLKSKDFILYILTI